MMRHKDGIEDQLWPVVEAETWEEAMALGGERVTYRCRDGTEITFGSKIVLTSSRRELFNRSR